MSRASAEQSALAALRARAQALAAAHPDLTFAGIAGALAVSHDRLRAAMGGEPLGRQVAQTARRYSDDDCFAALRRVAAELGKDYVTGKEYDDGHDPLTEPSAALLIQRFRSWSLACRAAGLKAPLNVLQGNHRRWSDEQILKQVAAYLREHPGGSCHAYHSLGRSRGWAGLGTVRSTFGSWSGAVQLAQRYLDP